MIKSVIFGERNRYKVTKRCDRSLEVIYIVEDAETFDHYGMDLPAVIRQDVSLRRAVEGLGADVQALADVLNK